MVWSVLQISDCHLVPAGETLLGMNTQDSLEAVLAAALEQRTPDAIVASGDLAHTATSAIYRRFVATVRRFSDAPLLCLPGNHDVLSLMAAAQLPMDAIGLGNWSIVPLDSHEDDVASARVDDEDRANLRVQMGMAQGAHCLVATHHPMLSVNSPWLDKDRIQNGLDLIEWLAECSVIKGAARLRGVVFGHLHQVIEQEHAGVALRGAPSTCFQFLPNSEKFGLDDLPPGFCWVELMEDGNWHRTVHRVETFPVNLTPPNFD